MVLKYQIYFWDNLQLSSSDFVKWIDNKQVDLDQLLYQRLI